ncbi:putative metal homeostasis protein [Companilactobacillus keshanensis]|uniref:Metal homeostasis protein n=1 Tax=Companilactobacillus keshanensis TaxID=2486003 RepID=A0ABW4BTT2_9LACO|nr:putative metal homeostasis protein [Companilactobacillus keshanensis]
MAEKFDKASSLRRLKSKNIKTRRRAKKILNSSKRKNK